MPTNLNNQASVTYSYSEGGTGAASSNMTTTTLLDEYSLLASAESLLPTYRPGENMTYIVTLENNGAGVLYSVTVTDDLGAEAVEKAGYDGIPLSYLEGSALLISGGLYYPLIPTAVSPQLRFVLPVPLQPQSTAHLIYMLQVDPELPATIASIENTYDAAALEGSASGAPITVTPAPSAVITAEAYAEVAVFKEADKATVNAGDTLTYTFTLTNTGNEAAENVRLTDVLPQNFTVSSIQSVTNGVVTGYTPADYTVSSANELTLPAAGAQVSISVPAAGAEGAGITTILVIGTV